MHGNKAKNLAKLQKLGLKVPEFYEVNANELAGIGHPETDWQLVAKFEGWLAETGYKSAAVRSSAEAEDSPDRSFAGQYDSVMDVKTGSGLLEALGSVAKSRPASAYDRGKKLPVHAIVQGYIEPDAAGVLFTVNPSNGLPEILINAAAGHGGKVVEGGDVLTVQIDRLTDDIHYGTGSEKLLPVNQLAALRRLGEKVESFMGTPQDIEWAIRNGELYALQTRPVTNINYLRVWDNANIGESFPGIVLPLTFSIARRGYELAYKSQGYEAGLDWYQLEANHRTFNSMVGLFAGRMYYNLASWYKFIGLFPNNSQNQKYLDEQLQTVGEAAYLPPSHYPLGYKLRFYAKIIRRSLFFENEKKRFWKSLEADYDRYEKLPAGSDLFNQLGRYAYIEQMVIPRMGRSADNDFFVMTYHGLLKNRLKKWLDGKDGTTYDFLGSLHDVISARQATLLSDIAGQIKQDSRALELIHAKEFDGLDTYLKNSPAAGLLTEYRAKFLHRFAEDQKIESVNPLLTNDGFYGLLIPFLGLDDNALEIRRKDAAAAEGLRSRKMLRQLNFWQRLIYRLLIGRLKHHLRIREHNRLLRGRAYAYLRELFIEVGVTLKSSELISRADDVYCLDIEEIFRLINAAGYEDDLQYLVTQRRKRYRHYGIIKVPSKFVTTALTDKLPENFSGQESSRLDGKTSLKGTISSPGTVEGRVIVLSKPVIPDEPFDILVVSHTDPGWTPLIALCKALIVEHGGILSHAAIVTRELGIPSIIGVENVTHLLKDGMKVRINTAKSTVDIL